MDNNQNQFNNNNCNEYSPGDYIKIIFAAAACTNLTMLVIYKLGMRFINNGAQRLQSLITHYGSMQVNISKEVSEIEIEARKKLIENQKQLATEQREEEKKMREELIKKQNQSMNRSMAGTGNMFSAMLQNMMNATEPQQMQITDGRETNNDKDPKSPKIEECETDVSDNEEIQRTMRESLDNNNSQATTSKQSQDPKAQLKEVMSKKVTNSKNEPDLD